MTGTRQARGRGRAVGKRNPPVFISQDDVLEALRACGGRATVRQVVAAMLQKAGRAERPYLDYSAVLRRLHEGRRAGALNFEPDPTWPARFGAGRVPQVWYEVWTPEQIAAELEASRQVSPGAPWG